MSFFEETAQQTVDNHGLWAEKYRPDIIENYICNDQLRTIVESFIEKKEIPHILFHGPAGTGKTTLAKIITKNIPCDVMYVNASDNTGVDFVREKIKPFAASMGFHDLKIVILDEADFMSAAFQASMRNLMETYSRTTRFILTCNYVEKIISPLISRTQVFKLEPPTMKDVALRMVRILENEKISFEKSKLASVIKDFYPDIRKIINFLQQSSTTGNLELVEIQSTGHDLKIKLIKLLNQANSNKKVFFEIRQLVNDAGVKMFDELYSELYNKIGEYSNGDDVGITIDISESLYQSSMVIDKEITFMACVSKILERLQKK
jgi:replication factor C small subunit